MKTSAAWREIALAYLAPQKSATKQQKAVASDGLCAAVGRLSDRGAISGFQVEEMKGDVQHAVTESGGCAFLHPYRNERNGKVLRGMIALIHAEDSAANERFKTTPGAFVLAGAL